MRLFVYVVLLICPIIIQWLGCLINWYYIKLGCRKEGLDFDECWNNFKKQYNSYIDDLK